jgi:hypothetical protein
MMKPIVFQVKLFRGEWDRERSQEALLKLMEALVQLNVGHLEQMRYPPLYRSGVRYRRESSEQWRDIPTLLELGYGDCEDLTCWRIAELRQTGNHAFPYVAYRRTGGVYRYHALVERFARVDKRTGKYSGSSIEDPSAVLGMPGGLDLASVSRRAA